MKPQRKTLKELALAKGISVAQLKLQMKLIKDRESADAAKWALIDPNPFANKGWNPRAGSKGVRHGEEA